MKVEFFVEGAYYHPEYPTPAVVILIRNNVDDMNHPTEPIIVNGPAEIKDAFREMFLQDRKTHKTSFLVPLDQYRTSGIMVGTDWRLISELTIGERYKIE